MSRSRGSLTVEFVLLAPLLVLLLVFVSVVGRCVSVTISVRRAAEEAARAASMVSAQRMVDTARARALEELAREPGCLHPRVSVTTGEQGTSAFVTVTASCELNRTGATGLVPFTRTITSASTEVIDVFTFR